MTNITNFEKPFRDTKKYILENLDIFDKNKNFISKLEDKEREEFESLEKEFKEKYEKFKDIKRFSIPIIGMISCGKSSFLNFLLGMNCLETDDEIATKCVVIIRHNFNLEYNEKYIYSVIIKERSEGFYDFEKDESSKSEDLNSIIKKRNDLIKNSSENEMPKKEDFFLIIEANLPLFKGDNCRFANYFEFLDLPGLDEGKEDSDSYKSSKFFKEQILPKIAYNSLFSILIFDAGRYMSENNPNIFKDYLNKYFPKNYKNSFFILNKIDLMDNEEEEKKKFEQDMLKSKLNVDLKDTDIHLQYLSCKKLTNQVKRHEDFQSYLIFLLTEGNKDETNLLEYLKKKLVEEFDANISEISDEETPNSEQKEEIKKKLEILYEEESNFTEFLNIEEYFNYCNYFNKKLPELKNKENENKQYKNEIYNKLFEDFSKSFTNSMNKFINIPNDVTFKDRIKKIEEYINRISKANKDDIIKSQKYIDYLYKGLNENIEISINQFNELKPIVETLYELENNLTIFKNLKEDFELLEFFIKKDKRLRIPLFGGYSTGKSSLLNCIIGKKILPEGNLVTTRKIIVIRNNDQDRYIISKADFIPTNKDEEYYYFKEDGKEILNCDESNYNQIYEFIKKENEDLSDKNVFFLLSVPILMFKKMKFSKEILNKVEFIDFPGINVDDNIIKEYFKKIVQLSDTFLFVNECKLIKNEGNINTIQKIINRIEHRRFDFDYNSCLFVLNKADKDKSGNINILQKKKEFEEILFGEHKIKVFDFFKKKENPEISVTIFSSHFYLKYLTFYDVIKNFKNYINKKIEDVHNKNKQKNYDLIIKLEKEINSTLEAEFSFDNDKLYENREEEEKRNEYLNILKSCLKNKGITDEEINDKLNNINNIINNYIKMINNLENYHFYKKSKASSFLEDLENKIIVAKNMTEKQYSEKIKIFINTLQTIFKLLQQKSINKKLVDMTDLKAKMNVELALITSKFEEHKALIISRIDSVYKKFLDNINILLELGNKEETKTLELKNKLEEFKSLYIKETEDLNKYINEQILILQVKLNNKINSKLDILGIIKKKIGGSYLKVGAAAIGFGLFAMYGAISLIIGGIFNFIAGIIYIFKGKDSLIKDLNNLKEEIKEQWDNTYYRSIIILKNLISASIKDLMIVYETQMSKINEKTIQDLYSKFIHILGDKYEGELKDGKKHGKGTYYCFDGSKYKGEYKDGLREGYGKMEWIENAKYEGEWKQNIREGFGKYYFQNGNYYIGYFKNDEMWGCGKFFNPSTNNTYEGEFVDDKEEGYGHYIWEDGCIYIGEFKDDSFCGIGIIKYQNGNRYEGEFNEGKNGIGTFYYANGNKFEGEWSCDKKNGKGIFYTNDGNKYEGYWKGNRKILNNYIENGEYIKKKEYIDHDKIKIEYKDGDIYQGEYNANTKTIEGYGFYFFNHGAKYEGHFNNNFFSGEGKISYLGDITSGFFTNGELNGEGIIAFKNGNILKGGFKKDKKEGLFLYYDKKRNKYSKRLYKDNYFVKGIDD